MKRLTLFFLIILVIGSTSIMVLFLVPNLRWKKPSASVYLDDTLLNSSRPAVILMYTNCSKVFHVHISMNNTLKALLMIEQFSKNLTLITLDNKTIEAPHVAYNPNIPEDWRGEIEAIVREGGEALWDFIVKTPNQPGDYDINFSLLVTNEFLYQSYKYKVIIRVESSIEKVNC